MLYSFTFPQEIIDSIQERIKVLERSLNDANPQDEAMAEILELANSRQISLSQLEDELKQLIDKLHRLKKLNQVISEKLTKGELAIIMAVRQNFIMKEIVDIYCQSFLKKDRIEILTKLTNDLVKIFHEIKINPGYKFEIEQKNELYIIVESLKHLILSLIKNSLRFNALSQEEISAFNLEDITPQESEAMLISLASTKKWDYVYRKLA